MNIKRSLLALAAGLGAATLMGVAGLLVGPKLSGPSTSLPAPRQIALAARYGALPLIFEANRGQADPRIKYYARGPGFGLYLLADSVVLSFCDANSAGEATCAGVRARLLGATERAPVEGDDPLPGKSNYFVGHDRSRWRTGITQYAKVRYREVYPGIDLVYYGDHRRLEYDFIVASGADPGRISLAFDGAERLYLDRGGDLHIVFARRELVQQRPNVFQVVDGQRMPVDGGFKLVRDDQSTQVAFAVGRYDSREPLIIDPVLTYSTYLGGSGSDGGSAIAIDGSGNAYIAGFTDSTDFPTANPLQASNTQTDAFVAKLNADGSELMYSTYFGGTGRDIAHAIAVDANGNAYVVGQTDAGDFPTANALQGTSAGGMDAFVTKLSADGSVLFYSTYLGGRGIDRAEAVSVDSGNNVYVAGNTNSADFPTVNPLQATKAGDDTVPDVFVAKVDAGGGALLYSTYLGGSDVDGETGVALAIDASGNACVVGGTYSTDFPIVNALQADKSGDIFVQNPFVAKLDAGGGALLYSTYLSGSNGLWGVSNLATGVACDSAGNAYVVGNTDATDFPTSANALQPNKAAGGDVFVTKLDPNGSALVYSTYLGGSASDSAEAVAVDAGGNAYVAGSTTSSDFPVLDALQTDLYGNGSFITKLAAAGDTLVYSTYLGGSDGGTRIGGIAVDDSDNVYVAGNTASTDFPTARPWQANNAGGSADVFVAKLDSRSTGGGGSGGNGGGGAFSWLPLIGLLGLAVLRPVRWSVRT